MPPSQGVVLTVREFAAKHAAGEEFARSSKQMNELLRIDKLEEAQRRMAELSRDKVQRAMIQTRSREQSTTSELELDEEETNEDNSLKDMAAEVRASLPHLCRKQTVTQRARAHLASRTDAHAL